MLSVLPVRADEPYQTIRAERKIGDARVRIIEYAEQFGDIVPAFGKRLWRTVLYVEVMENGTAAPQRVWQIAQFGRNSISLQSIVVSDAVNRRLIIASSSDDDMLLTALVALDGKVDPLPAEYDPKTKLPAWKNSHVLVIPKSDDGFAKPLGERELGMKLTHRHVLSLQSATKTDGGWRIDAQVHDANDRLETTLPGGAIQIQPNPQPVRRFAVLLDEECKSAKFEVLK